MVHFCFGGKLCGGNKLFRQTVETAYVAVERRFADVANGAYFVYRRRWRSDVKQSEYGADRSPVF